MSINFNNNEFIKSFETEQIIDQEKNISEYSIIYPDGARFMLQINQGDELVTFKLTKQELANPLFTVTLTGVKKMVCDATSVVIYEDEESLLTEPFFVITLQPYVSWHY